MMETENKTEEADETQVKENSASQSKKSRSRLGEELVNDPYGPLTGQILSAMKKGCNDSFLGAEPRLMQGVLLCTILVASETLGKVLDAFAMRRSKIIENEYEELTNLFIVQAHMPIQESFGFFDVIMRLTSGKVTPQMEFIEWQIIDVDPFYEPKTIEVPIM
jgi:ribosome assembly protein 1